MNALKYGYLSVKTGQVNNAVCAGSERTSSWMRSDVFENEVAHLKTLEENPILGFNKEFLRWMLSDGAGAMLLESEPKGKNALKIEWMEGYSYAFEMETCMYAGGDKLEDGNLKPWSEYPADVWGEKALFAMKQDTRLLGDNILVKGVDSLKQALDKHNINPDKWFLNLQDVGNVGAASIYLMLEELKGSGMLKKGDKILLHVPESARFAYTYAYLTVC